ncbi:unnamed protein product [Rotaria sp. Silwood2]|nr:unnamed protein product [Rotaria sp. Silwood2]
MNYSTVNILGLCDEILLTIFNKLNKIDVLYSFIGVNQKLDKLAQDSTFTRSVDLVTISSNEDNESRTNSILDRFCFDIIPRIQYNIECLTVGPLSTDRILRIGNYPKLNKLILVNLSLKMASRILNNGSSFIHIYRHQISHLVVTINDDTTAIRIKNVATNIFANILAMFTNLIHLDFNFDDNFVYPPTSFIKLLSTTCHSSSIVHLNVRVRNFDDCLCLLDGRLSQLHTFIVKIDNIDDLSMSIRKKVRNFES